MGQHFYYLRGEKQTIETLVSEYGDALVRYAYCHTGNSAEAEDIAEDAFVAFFLKEKRFESEAQIKAYLYKTVRRKCIDYHRSRKNKNVPLSDIENVLYFDGNHTFDERCDNERLYRCMRSLPVQYGETLYLCYFEGFSPEEIASVKQKTKKQIYNLLSRAKAALSKLLKKE